MTLALELLAAARRDDLLREQRRLRLVARLLPCRPAAKRNPLLGLLPARSTTEACAA